MVDKSRCEMRHIRHPRSVMQSKEEEMDEVEWSGRIKLNLSEKCRQLCVEQERRLVTGSDWSAAFVFLKHFQML